MNIKTLVSVLFSIMWTSACLSQNPIINTQFTADPTARVFDGKLYLYPSHDIPCQNGQGYIGSRCSWIGGLLWTAVLFDESLACLGLLDAGAGTPHGRPSIQ